MLRKASDLNPQDIPIFQRFKSSVGLDLERKAFLDGHNSGR
jgi:hypothetical protein